MFSTSESDETSSKDTLLDAIQRIINESQEIDKVARKIAEGCAEQGLKKVCQLLCDSIFSWFYSVFLHHLQNLTDVVDKIPAIASQLRIISSGAKIETYSIS